MLAWVREVGAERDAADGADLVHVDYHPGNILVNDGRVSAVIDGDGAGRGDRFLDLVTVRFDLARRSPHLADWLDNLLTQTVPPDRLRAYWALSRAKTPRWP